MVVDTRIEPGGGFRGLYAATPGSVSPGALATGGCNAEGTQVYPNCSRMVITRYASHPHTIIGTSMVNPLVASVAACAARWSGSVIAGSACTSGGCDAQYARSNCCCVVLCCVGSILAALYQAPGTSRSRSWDK